MKNKKHSIEFIFVLFLFAMFVVMCLVLVNMGSTAYSNISKSNEEENKTRTAILYISNKIRSANGDKGISIEEKNGIDVLVINSSTEVSKYNTIIFCKDGYLKEATVLEGDEYTLDFGSNLMKMQDINVEINDNLLSINLKDDLGKESLFKINIKEFD